MAAEEKWKGWASKQQKVAEHGGEREPGVLLGRQLAEAGRFAYAALCGISLAWLFPENEQSSFRTEFIKGFVKWLDLPDAVLPAMTAFADGLGDGSYDARARVLICRVSWLLRLPLEDLEVLEESLLESLRIIPQSQTQLGLGVTQHSTVFWIQCLAIVLPKSSIPGGSDLPSSDLE